MPDAGFTIMAAQLAAIAKLIAAIPLDDLIEHCDRAGNQIARADSIGCLLSPTAYRNALYDGSLDDARRQRDIAQAILDVRRAVQIREDQRAKALSGGEFTRA